ncbi:hypothetical protein F4810DRAFT_719198 [Camillea tinctor]|nr:hypothetical protein F4810DRAFT_719198 [Camillea tinctor]
MNKTNKTGTNRPPRRPRCDDTQPSLTLNLYTDVYCRVPATGATVSLSKGECDVILYQDVVSVILTSSSPMSCVPSPIILTASDEPTCGGSNGALENLTFSGPGDCRVYTAGPSIGALWYDCPCSSSPAATTSSPYPFSSVSAMSARDTAAQKETALTAAVVVLSITLVLVAVTHILSCLYCPYCWINLCSPGRGRRIAARAERREMRGEAAGAAGGSAA